MSDEPVLASEENVGGDQKVKTREAAEQAHALDKLTDRVITVMVCLTAGTPLWLVKGSWYGHQVRPET